MKAITLWQPWASLIGRGKDTETRSWRYSGLIPVPLAIHAAKKLPKEAIELCYQEPFRSALLAAGFETPGSLPRGMIVATCLLTDCRPTEQLYPTKLDKSFGDFRPGRYGWILSNIRILNEPIPAKGMQGVWNWDEGMVVS